MQEILTRCSAASSSMTALLSVSLQADGLQSPLWLCHLTGQFSSVFRGVLAADVRGADAPLWHQLLVSPSQWLCNMETPCHCCAQLGLLFAVSAARQRTEWPKEDGVSSFSAIFSHSWEAVCVWQSETQCGKRSSAPFSYMLPLWPEHSRGFHMLSWPDWCFPSNEFIYKREHMNCSFISHPSCLCWCCSQSALVVLHLFHLQICFNQDLFFVVYHLDRLFAFSSLTSIISTLAGLHTVSADLGLEIHSRRTILIPFQLHAVFSLG